MRIERMRVRHTEQRLREIYAKPHDHRNWDDHLLRVDATIVLGKWLIRDLKTLQAADLSCGNAHIINGITHGVTTTNYLGDFAPGYDITGPLEETIHQIPHVDLFVLSETIEHIDDPDLVLSLIREKSDRLVLSTPIDELVSDGNEEHYWAWDVEGVAELLRRTGWQSVTQVNVNFHEWHYPYNFQIWGCK